MHSNSGAGLKSRHYRDESDPLLGFYSSQIAATTSLRPNTLHSALDGSSSSYYYAAPQQQQPYHNNGQQRPVSSSSRGDIYRSNHGGSDGSDEQAATSILPHPLSASFDSEDTQDDDEDNKHHKHRNTSQRRRGYRIHRVSYTPQNHIQVLFRMHSSAFPQVLPFCILNICWALAVITLKNHSVLDLTFHSSIGHSFMGLLVSFLVVSRSKIAYDRFMVMRRQLATTYRVCRELAQFATIYSSMEGSTNDKAREWRHRVCYRTILLLRVTMDGLLWSSTERHQWEDEYFQYRPASDGVDKGPVSKHFFRYCKLTHGRRSLIDEHFRAPIAFAHTLRQVILQHPQYLGYKMAVNEYRDLLHFVTTFMDAVHEFRVLTFTPYPFPLVQMTRTFLIFWVYSLPLVLLKEYRLWSTLLIVTFVTLGFIGVEYVSMALDDPFGDETNDVDEHGMALLVYEDIYMALYKTDGYTAAKRLRDAVVARYKMGRELDCYRSDMKGCDFWEPYGKSSEDRDGVENSPV